MNPRPEALPVKWIWRTACLYACLLGLCAPAHAAVRKPDVQQATPTPAHSKESAKDLLLGPDDLKKADAMASFIEGNIAEENADTDRALDDYRKVLETDPTAKIRTEDGSNTLMLLSAKVAFELARRGDTAAGIDLLKDTVKAAPKESMAYFYLSQLYEKFLKKNDIALKYASQALELDPNNFIFYLANYEILLNSGQSQKAADLLERARQQHTDDVQYWLKLGELYVHATVRENGPTPADDLKKMNGLFQKALTLANDNPDVLIKVADLYVLTRQLNNAIPIYSKVLQLKDSSSSDATLSDVREKLAESYLAVGKRDAAIRVLENLLKSDPLNYSTYGVLGRLYASGGDYEKALSDFQQTLLIKPDDWHNYGDVLDMLLQLKKFDRAVELMRQARQNFPDVPRMTYGLAIALSGAKKTQEAFKMFEQAFNEGLNADTDMLNGDFYFGYGAAAEQAGQIEKAADMFKKAISFAPDKAAEAYNYLGFMWVDRGQNLEEAGSMIKRALQIDPDNAAFIDSLGWYYYKKGEPDKALEQLLKAASAIKPEDPVVYDHIGDTYQKLGNMPQALSYWQKAAVLDPDNKQIAEKVEGAKQKVTSAPSPQQKKP